MVCTLDGGQVADRERQIRAVIGSSLISADRIPDGVVLRLRSAPGLEEQVREIVRLENDYCAFLDFSIEVTPVQITLQITGPPEAEELITGFAITRA